MALLREQIINELIRIFEDCFEIKNPGMDDNLRDEHEFDSIDAIELLGKIEIILDFSLTRDEKEKAMEIRTINDILDYIEGIVQSRNKQPTSV